MSIKEQIVEKLRAAGYDFLTACEDASTIMREFKESGDKSCTFHVIANRKITDSFILNRK